MTADQMDTPAPPASIITQVNVNGDQVIVSPEHKGKSFSAFVLNSTTNKQIDHYNYNEPIDQFETIVWNFV